MTRRAPAAGRPACLAAALAAAALAPGALLGGCSRSGPDPEAQARALQVDLHRAFLSTRGLGRFGELGLFEEEMDRAPCLVPLSATNRTCEVSLVGRGRVRMQVAGPDLEQTGLLRKDALVSVEYLALDCSNERFDFKTVDNVLPRGGPSRDGVTVWENKLLRVTHRKIAGDKEPRCTLTIEAAPSLLARVRELGRQPAS